MTKTITTNSAALDAFHPELSSARRWAILLCCMLGTAVSTMGNTTMTASLTSIITEFGVSSTQGQWLTTSYMLTMGIMIPCTGYLMTRFQSRHLFVAANLVHLVGIFGVVAPDFWTLVAIRCIQGFSAGILVPLMQVVTFRLFPPQRRGFAMGVGALALTIGPAAGPTVAGLITDAWGWRAIFLVVAALTIASLLSYAVLRALREETQAAAFDVPSAILIACGFSGIIIGVANLGSTDVLLYCLAPVAVGVTCLVIFARRQLHADEPFLELAPFRSSRFLIGSIAVLVIFGLLVNTETFICLYLQHDLGVSPTAAGLTLLPGTLLAALISPFTGRVLDRRGPLPLVLVGFPFLVTSAILNALVQAESPLWYSVAVFTLRCIANACLMQHLLTWAVNGLDGRLTTHGTAAANTLRQVGAALINSLFFALMGMLAASSDELDGIKGAMGISSIVLAVLGVIVIAYLLKKGHAQGRGKHEGITDN